MWNTDWTGMHHWFWMWGFPFGSFWFLLILGVLFVVLVTRSPHRRQLRSAALNLLEERYARGEIGRDEYLEKKKDLLS